MWALICDCGVHVSKCWCCGAGTVLFQDVDDCPCGLKGVPTTTGVAVVSSIGVYGPRCDSGTDADGVVVILTLKEGVNGKQELAPAFMGGSGGIVNIAGECGCSILGAGA